MVRQGRGGSAWRGARGRTPCEAVGARAGEVFRLGRARSFRADRRSPVDRRCRAMQSRDRRCSRPTTARAFVATSNAGIASSSGGCVTGRAATRQRAAA